ncbi:MAG: hypothetical protein H6851_07555 [Geminicoccaceae bacterium]|nr:hypothetical protein [Geminicoccaceae bacterium]
MSSPFGKRGHFFDEWTNGGETWQRFEIPAGDVPRISAGFLAAERRALGADWFAQEYGCRFLDAAGSLFSGDDIAAMLSGSAVPVGHGLGGLGDVAPLRLPEFGQSCT